MSITINQVHIKNFRSARNLSIALGQLSVLVGKNDSGKSNVLRALNLFFNEKTDNDNPLNFSVDHNIFNNPNRRAREISVAIEISLPENYRRVNGDIIIWEKRWRAEGLVYNKYHGRREVEGPRGGVTYQDITIPERSNVHTLLRNIRYVYVPAIKDIAYFSELRARIYDVISDVANHDFRESSRDFESSISHQLEDLTDQISHSLGLQSKLALPRDLSHIFESLDFLSDEQNISLDVRGDGVKARHIPLILKFMADKKINLQPSRAQPYNFIWGYEEPENSLELSSSVELADQFWRFVNDGISQILITTHSPVFYNLYRKNNDNENRITCHHMYRHDEDVGTKAADNLTDLDERMGTTALFAPMMAELEEQIRRQEAARAEVEAMARENRRKLFVEGPSDKNIIEKALRVFSPERATEIDVETKNDAGTNYVVDMLSSWRTRAKHHPDLPRAAGLVDSDAEGKKAAKSWNTVSDNVKSAKCFKLETPPHIIPIKQAGFELPVVLETLYNREAWIWAEENDLLTPRHIPSIIPEDLNSRIIVGETTLEDNIHEDWDIFIKKEFLQEGKGSMSRHFSRKPDEEFRDRFSFMEQTIANIVSYLFPNN